MLLTKIRWFLLAWFLAALPAWAQLADETQITPGVPGGSIAKSLDEQVGQGHGDVNTPGSAIYLIKRDPARSIRRGRQLFQRKFTANQGLGPRVNPDSGGNIMDDPGLGAGLSDSCAGCHGGPAVPRVSAATWRRDPTAAMRRISSV